MKILAVVAHYDDLELSAGGTIAKFIKQGHQVRVVTATKSNYTDYTGKVLRDNIDAAIEGLQSLVTLGVQAAVNLGYDTKNIPFNSEIVEKINKEIDKYQPDIVITHALNESHQDHFNLAKSVMAAARYQKTIWMFETLYPSKTSTQQFRPLIYIDITDTFDIKMKALKDQKSQWQKYPHWSDLVTSLARVRGIEIGTEYAECFDIIKMEYII